MHCLTTRGIVVISSLAAGVVVGAPNLAVAGERVAVFDFGGPKRSARAGRYMAKRMRAHGAKQLAAHGWSMMPKGDMVKALGSDGKACVRTGACDRRVGKKLGVGHVVHAEMASFGDLQLTLEVRDGRSGKRLRETTLLAARVDGLVDQLPDAWKELFPLGVFDDDEPLVTKSGQSADRRPSAPAKAQALKPTTDASKAHGTIITRGTLVVTGRGKIDEGQMSAALDRYLPQMHRCYGKQLAKDGSLSGDVELELSVNGRGKLEKATVAKNTTSNSTLAKCIVKRSKSWKLPTPWGGGVAVAYALQLSPQLSAAGGGADADGLSMKQQYGTIDAEKVETVVFKNIDQVQKCYVRGWKKNNNLKGSLTIKFQIAMSGRVKKAEVIDDELGSSKVSRCIRSRILSWRFSKPTGGPALVHYPFTFS